MQTFFINIQEGGVDLERHEKLLEGLTAQGDLFHHNCSLNAMGVCAGEIASRISRYDEVGEDYNLLIYIQVPGRNEEALAAECALSVLIEEELLASLYRLGRKPREVLILFGENFTRNRQYGSGRGFAEKQRFALWDMFPFRSPEEVTEELLTLKARGNLAESPAEFQNALSGILFSDGRASLLGLESIFLQEVLPVFSETVQKNTLDNESLPDILSKVVHNQRLHVNKQVTGAPVRYAHVRLEDSDYNARVRSEFRILLYVCLAADSGEFPMLAESVDDGSKNREIIGEASLPRLDLDALATELKKRYAILAEEYSLLDSGEEEFHAFKDDNLKNYFDLTLDGRPEFDLAIPVHRGLGLSALRQAVSSTLLDARQRWQEAENALDTYVTRVGLRFKNEKKKLEKLPILDESRTIESVELTGREIEERIRRAGLDLVARRQEVKGIFLSAEERVDAAKVKTDYLFSVLRKRTELYVILSCALLGVMVPYAILQPDLWKEAWGWVFFCLTLLCTVGALGLGYGLFYMVYRHRIIRVLRDLRRDFDASMEDWKKMLDDYMKILTEDIPNGFALGEYRRLLREYAARRNRMPLELSYHTKCLREYMEYVENLISDMDLTQYGEKCEIEPGYERKLVIEDDQFENDGVYTVVEPNAMPQCWLDEEGGE